MQSIQPSLNIMLKLEKKEKTKTSTIMEVFEGKATKETGSGMLT